MAQLKSVNVKFFIMQKNLIILQIAHLLLRKKIKINKNLQAKVLVVVIHAGTTNYETFIPTVQAI